MSTTRSLTTQAPTGMFAIASRPLSRRNALRAALGLAAAGIVAGPRRAAAESVTLGGLIGAAPVATDPASRSGLGMPAVIGSATRSTRIDPTRPCQTVEGWGTSLAWWANAIGGWSDASRNAIADQVFSPMTGLGLNVVRYNIGGGDDPTHHHMRPAGAVPGFQPSQGVWDWNADANQRWMLQAARDRGANAFEAFSNSPPYWMTRSGCASGSDDGSSNNLQDGHIDNFAAYLAEVVAHFRDQWGLTFRSLEPFNEPSATYWKSSHNQEGCHVSRAQQRAIIARLSAHLSARGLTETAIVASDEYSIDDLVTTLGTYDRAALSHVSRFNTHSYSGTRRADVRALAKAAGKGLWMSEFGTGGGHHDHHAMLPALRLAAHLRRDVNELQPSAWVYWQAVEHEGNNNWGFIHADLTGKSERYWLTKQYYAMAHYSKFIRPGYRVLAVDDGSAVAAYDHASATLVIVHDNSAAHAVSARFDLSRFTRLASTALVYRTSPAENLARASDIELARKSLPVVEPAQSITTYVLTGVEL